MSRTDRAGTLAGVETVELQADCSRCAALCCVLPGFSRSADFPIDKPAGRRCPNLGGDDRCTIHAELRTRGFVGCDVFDCFGAGQRLTAARPNPADHPDPADLAETFLRLRHLHELLRHLDEAGRSCTGELRHEVNELAADGYAAGVAPSAQRVAALMTAGSDLLGRVSTAVRGPGGPDRRGQDLSGRDLRSGALARADLRGALLIGADLRGVVLDRSDLLGADLRGADLRGADLSTALFVTGPQLSSAQGDGSTVLPAAIRPPRHWPRG